MKNVTIYLPNGDELFYDEEESAVSKILVLNKNIVILFSSGVRREFHRIPFLLEVEE